jgi:hypothetical protein
MKMKGKQECRIHFCTRGAQVLGVGEIVRWGMVLGIAFLLYGCGSSPEAPDTTPTTSEIRGDSDRFFEKMQKEEAANKEK